MVQVSGLRAISHSPVCPSGGVVDGGFAMPEACANNSGLENPVDRFEFFPKLPRYSNH